MCISPLLICKGPNFKLNFTSVSDFLHNKQKKKSNQLQSFAKIGAIIGVLVQPGIALFTS